MSSSEDMDLIYFESLSDDSSLHLNESLSDSSDLLWDESLSDESNSPLNDSLPDYSDIVLNESLPSRRDSEVTTFDSRLPLDSLKADMFRPDQGMPSEEFKKVLTSLKDGEWLSNSTIAVVIQRLEDLLIFVDSQLLEGVTILPSTFVAAYNGHKKFKRSTDRLFDCSPGIRIAENPRLIIAVIHAEVHWQITWITIGPDGGVHWFFYCPMNWNPNMERIGFMEDMLKRFRPNVVCPKTCTSVLGPKQGNGDDCGVFVLTAFINLINGVPGSSWTFSQDVMPIIRETFSALVNKDVDKVIT
jgi:hypothetical protein